MSMMMLALKRSFPFITLLVLLAIMPASAYARPVGPPAVLPLPRLHPRADSYSIPSHVTWQGHVGKPHWLHIVSATIKVEGNRVFMNITVRNDANVPYYIYGFSASGPWIILLNGSQAGATHMRVFFTANGTKLVQVGGNAKGAASSQGSAFLSSSSKQKGGKNFRAPTAKVHVSHTYGYTLKPGQTVSFIFNGTIMFPFQGNARFSLTLIPYASGTFFIGIASVPSASAVFETAAG